MPGAGAVYDAALIIGYNNTEFTWTLLNSWGSGTNNTAGRTTGTTADGTFRIQMGVAGAQCVVCSGHSSVRACMHKQWKCDHMSTACAANRRSVAAMLCLLIACFCHTQ